MPFYEVFAIAKPMLASMQCAEVLRGAATVLLKSGAILTDIKNHGERPLAYTIRRPGAVYNEAFMWQMGFMADPRALKDLDHQLRVDERVSAEAERVSDVRVKSARCAPALYIISDDEDLDEVGGQQGGRRPAHQAALERAMALERALVDGGARDDDDGLDSMEPIDSIRARLKGSADDWPAEGAPIGIGGDALAGGRLRVRVDLVAPLAEAAADHRTVGVPRAIACFHGLVALGLDSGLTLVLLPRGLGAADSAAAPAAPQVARLGEPRAGDDAAVTAMAFGPMGNLLAVGHANGDVAFWELKRTGWECVKALKEAHVTAVSAAAFVAGAAAAVVTADTRGRVVLHNVSVYLSLTGLLAGRLGKGAQPVVLLDGRQLGPVALLAPLLPAHPLAPRAPADASDAARSLFLPPQEGGAGNGALLIGTARGVFVCRLLPEGRLAVVHSLPRPASAREGCLPCVAWRPRPRPPEAGRPASALLAVAWEADVEVYDVPLRPLARPHGGEAGAAPAPPAPPAVQREHAWREDRPVAGLGWLDGPALSVACEVGPRTRLRFYDAHSAEERECVEVPDALICQDNLANRSGVPEQAYHAAVAASPDRVLLLSTQGVRAARVMRWEERLAALRDARRWRHALALALDILAAAHAIRALPSRGDGRGADVSAVGNALVALLLGFLDAALASGEPSEDAAADAQVADAAALTAAEVALDACLALGRPGVLWEEVAPRFRRAGRLGALLERLLPRVLAGRLAALAPEIMQALVERCAADGRAADVERCVLRLDLASLDFNQVTRLCRAHRLHTALASLFTRALADYAAPAAELLLTATVAKPEACPAAGAAWGERAATAYKLLIYLRCCFRGHAFPPGSGELPAEARGLVRAQLLGLLLYATPAALLRLTAAFGGGDAPDERDRVAAAMPGPHPALRVLAALDAGATFAVVAEALAGWDALASELREAAGLPPAPSDNAAGDCSATQAMVAAALALVTADALRAGAPAPTDGPARALDFAAERLADGRATAPPDALLRVLAYVALGPWPADSQGTSPKERERRFVALLRSGGLRAGAPCAGFGGGWEIQRALSLAQAAGFARGEAQVHHVVGEYEAALACLLRAELSAAFEYADAHLAEPNCPPGLRAAVLAVMGRLADANGEAAARLVLRYFPTDHAAVLAGFASAPERQFRFLRGALQAVAAEPAEAGRASPRGAQEALLAAAGGAELYAGLLCRFEPASVLPFLQAHDAYRVEAVLPATERYGVTDARAFLLERLGDVTAALQIHVDAAAAANDALVEAVLAGALAALMEQAIGAMAGHVPLAALGRRILAAYASEPFGDFKGPLVGLLAATSYETAILAAAARLASADAFRTLAALKRPAHKLHDMRLRAQKWMGEPVQTAPPRAKRPRTAKDEANGSSLCGFGGSQHAVARESDSAEPAPPRVVRRCSDADIDMEVGNLGCAESANAVLRRWAAGRQALEGLSPELLVVSAGGALPLRNAAGREAHEDAQHCRVRDRRDKLLELRRQAPTKVTLIGEAWADLAGAMRLLRSKASEGGVHKELHRALVNEAAALHAVSAASQVPVLRHSLATADGLLGALRAVWASAELAAAGGALLDFRTYVVPKKAWRLVNGANVPMYADAQTGERWERTKASVKAALFTDTARALDLTLDEEVFSKTAEWAADAGQAWPPCESVDMTRAAAAEAVAGAWRAGRLLQDYRALYAHDVDVSTGAPATHLGCDQATLFNTPPALPPVKTGPLGQRLLYVGTGSDPSAACCCGASAVSFCDDGLGATVRAAAASGGRHLDLAVGVTYGVVIMSMAFTRTTVHVEDGLLAAYNMLVLGAPKVWYIVPRAAAPAFEAAVVETMGRDAPEALASLAAKRVMPALPPARLRALGALRVVQMPGYAVVTLPVWFSWARMRASDAALKWLANTAEGSDAAQDACDALAMLVDRGATTDRVLRQLVEHGPLRAPGAATQARLDAATARLDAISARMAEALPV
ncbi:hypothetical protein WJX81_004448 [Elliptochloris bilobata]|uniref:Uncharacterized protein n=1 Tax=Elliptochloris bilobata TaxID=381761 RepID=A0AAW1S3X2_9CHLO